MMRDEYYKYQQSIGVTPRDVQQLMANQMLLEKQLFTEIEWSCIISSWTEKKRKKYMLGHIPGNDDLQAFSLYYFYSKKIYRDRKMVN